MHRIALLLAMCSSATYAAGDRAAFDSLKPLAGTWQPAQPADSPMRVTFELLAKEGVLVETWRSPSHRSMTVYHFDGDTLLATHYCPQGNVPRLALVRTEADGTLRFELRDGSNIDVPGGHHEHVLTLRREGDDLVRGEAYAENAKPFDAAGAELDITKFRRVVRDIDLTN